MGDASDVWKPHFVYGSCCLLEEGNGTKEGILKSSTGRAIILYEQHHTRQCINTTSIIYQYHTHHTTLTHIHTRIVCLATIFKIRGTQFVTLYGIHISMLPIYIYIYKRPYIYLYD